MSQKLEDLNEPQLRALMRGKRRELEDAQVHRAEEYFAGRNGGGDQFYTPRGVKTQIGGDRVQFAKGGGLYIRPRHEPRRAQA